MMLRASADLPERSEFRCHLRTEPRGWHRQGRAEPRRHRNDRITRDCAQRARPQHDMVAVAELMNIKPETCSNIAQGSQLESFCACEPSPRVSFTFPASPSNVVTVIPAHCASAASSVKSLRPADRARRWASSRAANWKACGSASRSVARSRVRSLGPERQHS